MQSLVPWECPSDGAFAFNKSSCARHGPCEPALSAAAHTALTEDEWRMAAWLLGPNALVRICALDHWRWWSQPRQ